MTKGSFARNQRRQLEKESIRGISTPITQTTPTYVTEEKLKSIIQDQQKILNFSRYVENKLTLLLETLIRKEVIISNDILDTEELYIKKEENKAIRVKELLSQEKTVQEYLEDIKEDPKLLGFQKLNIHPVKDLNLNPYEVGLTLKETNPNLSNEAYLELGRKWGLGIEHFGIK